MISNNYKNLRHEMIGGSLFKEGIYAANIRLPDHFHEQPNFCLVLEGNCTERLGSKTVDFKPLTLGFLATGDRHSLQTNHAPIRCFGIELAPALIERLRECSLEMKTSTYTTGGSLVDLLTKIYREFHLADNASPLAIEGLLLELLVEAARCPALTKEKRPPLWLKQAEELLRANFSNPLQLPAIADAVNIHPVHLAREFRRHFKCTVGEYVRRLRVDFARRELSHGSAPLVIIALSAGFSDQSHLTREFKRITGFTPLQYRSLFKAR
jgi:AraC family transcriptional regulator